MVIKMLKKAYVLAIALAALVAGCGGGGGNHSALLAGRYTVAELSAPNGSSSVSARMIDNQGRIVGCIQDPVTSMAGDTCVWQPGHVVPDVLHGDSLPSGINNNGQGVCFDGGPGLVLNLLDGSTTQLPDIAGGGGEPWPEAINDRGVCVGSCLVSQAGSSSMQYQAVVWDEHGDATALETPDGCIGSSAEDINNSGLIVGEVTTSDGVMHAAIWSADGHLQKVITEPPGFHWSEATHVNDAGEVLVDFDFNSTSGHFTYPGAAVYGPDGSFRLLARPGNRELYTADLNVHGQVAGILDGGSAVVWNPDGSVEQFPSPHVGLFCGATGINDNGVVVGAYGPDAKNCHHAVVWTPIH